MKKLIYIAVIISFAASLNSAKAESVGLGVTKNTFDLEIQRGDSYTGKTGVFNTSTTIPLPVKVQLSLWDLGEGSDDIEFVTAEESLNATKWFTVSPANLILGPDRSQEIEFEINIPEDASPGTYLVMMRFQAVLPEHYFESEGPRFSPEIGTLFFVKVPLLALEGDRMSYGAEIVSVEPQDTDRSIFQGIIGRAQANVFDNAIKKLMAKVKNNGIYYFKSSGFVEIKNLFGITVAKVDIKEKYLLPNKVRNLEIELLPPPPQESNSLTSNILNYITYSLKENSYLGPYTASITLSIPNEPPAVSSINFWVIPWKFWLPVLLVISTIIYGFIKFRHKIRDFFVILMRGKAH